MFVFWKNIVLVAFNQSSLSSAVQRHILSSKHHLRSWFRTRIKKMKKTRLTEQRSTWSSVCLSVRMTIYLDTLRFEISRIFYWPLPVCMTSYITLGFESLSVWRHIFRYFRVQDFKASCMPPTSRRPSLFLKQTPQNRSKTKYLPRQKSK